MNLSSVRSKLQAQLFLHWGYREDFPFGCAKMATCNSWLKDFKYFANTSTQCWFCTQLSKVNVFEFWERQNKEKWEFCQVWQRKKLASGLQFWSGISSDPCNCQLMQIGIKSLVWGLGHPPPSRWPKPENIWPQSKMASGPHIQTQSAATGPRNDISSGIGCFQTRSRSGRAFLFWWKLPDWLTASPVIAYTTNVRCYVMSGSPVKLANQNALHNPACNWQLLKAHNISPLWKIPTCQQLCHSWCPVFVPIYKNRRS